LNLQHYIEGEGDQLRRAVDATMDSIELVASNGGKAVIGTTGLSQQQISRLGELSQSMAIVYAPNMSIGMNLLFKLTSQVCKALGNAYDVEIIESHHHNKKDAPSGSALRLAQAAAEGLNRDLEKCGVYGRKGMVGERKPEEIAIHAVRAGDIVGDHTVMLGGLLAGTEESPGETEFYNGRIAILARVKEIKG